MPSASHLSERRFEVVLAGALLRAGGRMEHAANAALEALQSALQCDVTLLIVPVVTGRARIFGDAALVGDLNPHGDRSRFVATEDLGGLGTLTVAIRRSDGRAVRPQQERLTDRAARMLAAWAVGILGSSEPAMERRAYSRPIEQDFERMAHAMIANGRNASAILLHVEDLPSLTARRLVDHLRANLRACELVGAVGDGDIAVLLFNVSAEESSAIAARLRHLTEEQLVGSPEPVQVGTAYYPAGSAAAGPILAAARTAARLGVSTISSGRESSIAPPTN